MAAKEKAKQLHLNYFHYPTGHHSAAWRLPESDPIHGMSLEHHVSAAEEAEAACFDSVFLAHTFGAVGIGGTNIALMWDPPLVLATMAARTRHIGLIGTMSTSYIAPYDMAQKFATLDQLSGGRAGWNIVTSSTEIEGWNFGLDTVMESAVRYRRAAEFVDVCKKLWNGWDDDALTMDKESGVFVDTDKVHEAAHVDEYFSVRGPLHLPPTPQRGPVLVQAGSSESGRDFAARYAEVVFTIQPEIEGAREFYSELKARAAAYGRAPESMVILPGLATLLGDTEADAHGREKELAELVSPVPGLQMLQAWLGMDFSAFPLDGPVPDLPDPSTFQTVNRAKVVIDFARRERPTLRQLAGMISAGRGHHVFVGTGEQLADQMEEWFRTGAADGFNVMPLILPSGLHEFVREVIPILQTRGVFRTEYEGTTLRDHYGLTSSALAAA